MKVAIYGGTFDPVHSGHLILAEHARELLGVDQVLFVVAFLPPHKTPEEVTPAEHRLEMVRLAIQGNPYFGLSDVEIRRGAVSYTVETLSQLRSQLGLARQELFFLMGADSLLDLTSWREPDRLFELAEIVVLRRPGRDPAMAPTRYLKRAKLLPTPYIEISSTDIRNRVRERRSIRYLVPDAVAEYIRQHGLYR